MMDPLDHLEDPAEQRPNLAAESFAGRTVLVVGGGGSIGAACAWLAARLGAKAFYQSIGCDECLLAKLRIEPPGIGQFLAPVVAASDECLLIPALDHADRRLQAGVEACIKVEPIDHEDCIAWLRVGSNPA